MSLSGFQRRHELDILAASQDTGSKRNASTRRFLERLARHPVQNDRRTFLDGLGRETRPICDRLSSWIAFFENHGVDHGGNRYTNGLG